MIVFWKTTSLLTKRGLFHWLCLLSLAKAGQKAKTTSSNGITWDPQCRLSSQKCAWKEVKTVHSGEIMAIWYIERAQLVSTSLCGSSRHMIALFSFRVHFEFDCDTRFGDLSVKIVCYRSTITLEKYDFPSFDRGHAKTSGQWIRLKIIAIENTKQIKAIFRRWLKFSTYFPRSLLLKFPFDLAMLRLYWLFPALLSRVTKSRKLQLEQAQCASYTIISMNIFYLSLRNKLLRSFHPLFG